MRLFLFLTAVSVVLPSIGCNSTLKCRRETALLRAEYLDLEDKYYALLANSGATTSPSVTSSMPTSSLGVIVDSQPMSQPVIYGTGVQQPVVVDNGIPEITYYDQAGGYPVQGHPIQGETYYSPQYPQTPTPASPIEIDGYGTSLQSSKSAYDPQETYYPSPVENTDSREPVLNQPESETLPSPDESLDNDQSRFDFEIEDTHEIGHEIKIEMSSPITEIVINKSVTQGKNSDGRPGDDGIELLIQPKTADGSVVDETGNLTIHLMDPAADEAERQIGQWTFLQEEAILFFAEDELDNRGILLNLKWEMIPINKRLTVYVRFETTDGRIMETTSDIIIDPPSDLAMIQQEGAGDFEFVQMQRDEEQGWYKSQSARRSNKEEDSYSDNWGRSEAFRSDSSIVNSENKRVSQRATVRPNRQPQWRPSR